MKGGLSSDGVLYIERAGTNKPQMCPYNEGACGDSCPLFGEPIVVDASEGDYGCVVLHTCNRKILEFEEFNDMRKGPAVVVVH